MEFNSLDEFYY